MRPAGGAEEGLLGTGADDGRPVCSLGRCVSEAGLAELTRPLPGLTDPTLVNAERADPVRRRMLGLSSNIASG